MGERDLAAAADRLRRAVRGDRAAGADIVGLVSAPPAQLSREAGLALCEALLAAGHISAVGGAAGEASAAFRPDSTLYSISKPAVVNPLLFLAPHAETRFRVESEAGSPTSTEHEAPRSISRRVLSLFGSSKGVHARWRGRSPPARLLTARPSRAHADADASSSSSSLTGKSSSTTRSMTRLLRGQRAHSLELDIAVAADVARENALVIQPAPPLDSDARFEGYLEKRGNARLVVEWRRRWFVLSGSLLGYFDGEDEGAALGVVDLGEPGLDLQWGQVRAAAAGCVGRARSSGRRFPCGARPQALDCLLSAPPDRPSLSLVRCMLPLSGREHAAPAASVLPAHEPAACLCVPGAAAGWEAASCV